MGIGASYYMYITTTTTRADNLFGKLGYNAMFSPIKRLPSHCRPFVPLDIDMGRRLYVMIYV